MLPEISTYLEDLAARLALDEDRRADARAAAGLPPAEERAAGPALRRGPIAHRVPSDVREYVIPDFRPGIDSCDIELSTGTVEVMHWQGPGGTVICIDDGAEQLAIAFMGLDEPPFDDITVAMPHRADGQEAVVEARAIDPGEIASDAVTVTPFLAPTAERPLAEFWGFDAAREVIEVMRSPVAAGDARVNVLPTPDARDAMIIIDGHVVAMLRGAPNASKRNVRVVASTDV